jgi:hypothetical protein
LVVVGRILGVFWCLGWFILGGGLVAQVHFVVLGDLMGLGGLVWSGSVHGETNLFVRGGVFWVLRLWSCGAVALFWLSSPWLLWPLWTLWSLWLFWPLWLHKLLMQVWSLTVLWSLRRLWLVSPLWPLGPLWTLWSPWLLWPLWLRKLLMQVWSLKVLWSLRRLWLV